MEKQKNFGIPEITQQDIRNPLQFAFRLNAILRMLASQISASLGLSGPVKTGDAAFTYGGPVSFQRGISVTGKLVALGESDGQGNWRTIEVGSLSEYADDAAAKAGGLAPGSFYRTADGVVMVVLPD